MLNAQQCAVISMCKNVKQTTDAKWQKMTDADLTQNAQSTMLNAQCLRMCNRQNVQPNNECCRYQAAKVDKCRFNTQNAQCSTMCINVKQTTDATHMAKDDRCRFDIQHAQCSMLNNVHSSQCAKNVKQTKDATWQEMTDADSTLKTLKAQCSTMISAQQYTTIKM